ncbi:hypothetical protein NQZ79_g1654 [Umbelopsis isabellina]|nr:hypothetical protein NQZ79_g1654 [Umbelopsis isabellina]
MILNLFILILCLILSVKAGVGTYADADITGPQTLDNATNIPTGFYSFRNHVTGQWLEFIPDGNQVQPSNGQNSTVFNGTLWAVKFHGYKNYSIHHLNGDDSSSGNDKCISTRWDQYIGIDDAAVMWQCELDNITNTPLDFDINPSFSGVYNPTEGLQPLQRRSHNERRYVNTYEPIRPDKQQWLFIPQDVSTTPSWKNLTFNATTGNNTWHGPHIKPNASANSNYGQNTFYLVSAAHLWNMYPRCIYPLPMNTFNFTANNTVVTTLEDCQIGNETLLWDMVLWEAENFPLGEASSPGPAKNPSKKSAGATLMIPISTLFCLLIAAHASLLL